MSNLWKVVIVVVVVLIAGAILVPKMIGTNGAGTNTTGGSSLGIIDSTLKNGKPTLLLLRTET